jgi:hypothetical protein
MFNNSKESNLQICLYVKYLFEYLGDKYCFTSGAFVIHDQNQNLYNILFNSKTTNLTYYGLESHRIYKNKNNCEDKKKCDEYETIFLNEISIVCKIPNIPNCNVESTRIFKSCKWYQFKYNNNYFVFLKPEDNPTINISHAIQAITRYTGYKSNISCRNSRREDCSIVEKNCRFNPNHNSANFENYDMYYDVKNKKFTNIIEIDYGRKGDEVFIMNDINEYILNYIKVISNVITSEIFMPDRLFEYNPRDNINNNTDNTIYLIHYNSIKQQNAGKSIQRRRKNKKSLYHTNKKKQKYTTKWKTRRMKYK